MNRRQYRHTVLTNQQKQAAALAQAQNQRASRPGPPAPGPGGPPPPPRNPQRPAKQARPQPPQQQLYVANQDSDENDSGVDKGGQSSPSQRSQPDGPSGQGGQKPKYTKRLYGRFDAYHDPNAQSDSGTYHYFFVVNILCFSWRIYLHSILCLVFVSLYIVLFFNKSHSVASTVIIKFELLELT